MEDDEESVACVPRIKRAARWVAKGVTVTRLGIIAVLSGFLIYGIVTDGLPELLIEADFDLGDQDCVAPERFALTVRNGSWKTAERVEVMIEARRKVPSGLNWPYLWGVVIDARLAPGESWADCLPPSISSKSNNVIANRREEFDWAVDNVYADFAE